ncbi:MAG: NAD(P)H-dependent oxidoreductase [Synergistaceae bacterium]|nr:NAD(P)H-dependent oxidoreductase [Synergistaceae bacterium]
MKALFINGSPRKNFNTSKMLESAMKGATEAGAETELIHLYDFNFKGCVSCFACKIKNSKNNGLCAIRDDLHPVLEKALNSDVLVMGSPIYFSYPTGVLRSFMERLMFPVLSYNVKDTSNEGGKILDRTIQTAMIYTMGLPEDMFDESNYEKIFGENERFLKFLFGATETLYAKNTYQFSDYSRYDVGEFIEPMKAKYRDEHFTQDLQNAYELGKRLVNKAKGEN